MTATKRLACKCPYGKCQAKNVPSNAASNFANPALSVKVAVETSIITNGQRVLEVGAGNLRNSLFVLNSVSSVRCSAFDLQETVNRFRANYEEFEALGGVRVKAGYGKGDYDVAICTFVLETICPKEKRVHVLRAIHSVLKKSGLLIASFRGHPGVRGSEYKRCPMGEGLITPHDTFVRPYSIPEVQQLLLTCGFKNIQPLQRYRVERPENIHIMAHR